MTSNIGCLSSSNRLTRCILRVVFLDLDVSSSVQVHSISYGSVYLYFMKQVPKLLPPSSTLAGLYWRIYLLGSSSLSWRLHVRLFYLAYSIFKFIIFLLSIPVPPRRFCFRWVLTEILSIFY